MIRARSLLIWSQTRYRCATESFLKIQHQNGKSISSLNRDKQVKDWTHDVMPSDTLMSGKMEGPPEIRTRIAGFKVQSANHYTKNLDGENAR